MSFTNVGMNAVITGGSTTTTVITSFPAASIGVITDLQIQFSGIVGNTAVGGANLSISLSDASGNVIAGPRFLFAGSGVAYQVPFAFGAYPRMKIPFANGLGIHIISPNVGDSGICHFSMGVNS